MSASPTLSWEQYQKIPSDKRSRPLTDEEYARLTPSQLEAGGLADTSESAPADFGGRILPNPGHIQPHLDTDPAMPITRLPNGVSFNRQNFSGTPTIDISNPERTQALPAAAHTAGKPIDFSDLGGTAVAAAKKIDFSDLGGKDVASQPSAASPIPPPALEKPHVDMKSVGLLTGKTAVIQDPDAPLPGVSEGRGLREGLAEYDRESFGSMGKGAADLAHGKIARGGHEVISGATNALTPIAPLLIPAAPAAAARGIIGGAAGGYVAGKGAEALGATPDQVDLAGDIGGITGGVAGAEAPNILRAPIRAAGRIATRIGKVADPDVIGIASPRAANAIRVARRVGSAANKIAGIETAPVFPGAPEPTATPEQLNPALVSEARTLPGQISPEVISPRIEPATPIPARPGLALPPGPAAERPSPIAASAPAATAEPAAAAAPSLTTKTGRIKPAVASDLDRMLNEATGGQPLKPGVPLKSQPAAQAAAATELPEGFTPVESSALKGYKYDPAAREFEYVTKDGSHYVRGDVAPEAFAKFQQDATDTGSHGKAWHALRDNPQGGVGQFKVINGKRVAVVKTAPVTDLAAQLKNSAEPSKAPTGAPLSDLAKQIKKSGKASANQTAIPKASSEGDLSNVLQQSVDQVKASKGKIPKASASPNYQSLIDAAMKEGPAWTPEKATPIVSELNKIPGNQFEIRGSVGDGRTTDNDLDLWQKSGSLKDARATLEKLGFKHNGKTPHGETYTNGAQHVDLWDSEHEPVKGYSGRGPSK